MTLNRWQLQTRGVTMSRWLRVAAVLSCVVLAGCATGPNRNPSDPLEPFNRSMFEFNDALDRGVVKPVATAYRDVTPELVRRGVTNFFNNLEDVWSIVNNALQLKGQGTANSLVRVVVNTTIGLAGVLDVATEMKVDRYTEDFGQTLGYWGVGAGPYIVLPVLGPSTVRDTVALPADWRGDLVTQQDDVALRNSLWTLRAVNSRARLLKAGEVVEEAALDKYTFIRDAFLQRRRSDVYDGNPPEEPYQDDPGVDAPR